MIAAALQPLLWTLTLAGSSVLGVVALRARLRPIPIRLRKPSLR